MIEISDALYRGREDFVYRITLGELPFVTSIFPLGGKAGTPATIAIQGWNLPMCEQTLDYREPGIFPVAIRYAGRISNYVPFAVDTLPECFEREPDNSSTNAQPVTLPILVNGRIDAPGDVDVFRFDGHAGDQVVAEVYARRLDSPLDSVLKLTDAGGRQLACNDDYEDKGSGLDTHHADSCLTATLPANGPYYIHLWDAQQKGGRAHGYRLRITPPRPDFALRVVPSALSVRSGTSVPITVYALRRDGFAGEIALALKNAPRRVQAFNRPGGNESGPGETHAERTTRTHAGASPFAHRRPCDDRRPRDCPAGRAGGRHDAGFRLPASRSRPEPGSAGRRRGTLQSPGRGKNPQCHPRQNPRRRDRACPGAHCPSARAWRRCSSN